MKHPASRTKEAKENPECPNCGMRFIPDQNCLRHTRNFDGVTSLYCQSCSPRLFKFHCMDMTIVARQEYLSQKLGDREDVKRRR